jgi:L-cysteine:1D-myo-inositol 2-amino-2-deoxy-alpha-D-glucopyranoside ligase
MLHLYNSLSGRPEPFEPVRDPVTMYVCGVTPYDTTHVGHAFTFVAFDALQRYLQFQGHTVRHVRNLTDVDDSILQRARERRLDYRLLGEEQIDQFHDDMEGLNCLPPTVEPRASDEIPFMQDIVRKMIETGAAYSVDGWVYLHVGAFPEYGRLGKFSRDEMLHLSAKRGADPEDPHKKDPLDFVLWQPSLPDEPKWEAPWGAGRPGWHLECTAMSLRYLGESIDVHGGGADLIYPHHESEIAQSELFTGVKPFARFWMHTGMVRLRGEKMSKSLGNLVLARDLLEAHTAGALRLYLFSFHYRAGWDFDALALRKFDELGERLEKVTAGIKPGPAQQGDAFLAAMDDDLNTPAAIAELRRRLAEAEAGEQQAIRALATYKEVLGL